MEPLDNRFQELENPSRTGYLIGGFITGTLSIEEREELDAWVLASDKNMQLFEDMTEDNRVNEFLRWLTVTDVESRLAAAKVINAQRKGSKLWDYLPYVAAAAIVVVFGCWHLFRERPKAPKTTYIKKDLVPGSLQATLRLPDGRVIPLEGKQDTAVDNIEIKNGTIGYLKETIPGWHEVTIPRKGYFHLLLPDGTRVWLNSASSIRYPGSFESHIREVTVTGETFFEVAPDKSRPFVVTAGHQKIHALGTAFNINLFENNVTLTEGAIKVERGESVFFLSPGQQLTHENKTVPVNIVPVMAWTKNTFRFHNQTIQDIIPQLERWYDARFTIQDSISYHFNGTIERTVPISRVLQLLQGTDQIHFIIQDHTIIVKK